MKRILPAFLIFFLFFNSVNSQTLLHYWNFNLFDTEVNHLAPSFTLGGGSLSYVPGGSSVNDFANGTGQNFNLLNLNARNGDPSGNHLRINNPIGASLIFSLPTTGYSNVIFRYATRRSGSGAGLQSVFYSTDGTNFISLVTIAPNNGDPSIQTLDFDSIPVTDNNPNFKIRIEFSLGTGGTVGNNRFDNVTLDGTTVGADVLPPSTVFSPANGAIEQAANTIPTIIFNEPVRKIDNSAIDNTNVDGLVILKLSNASGPDVPFDASFSGSTITITPASALNSNQTYYVALKGNEVEDLSNNAITTVQSVVFTTIAQQTLFNSGDILLVAYQMNAVPNSDRFAFVTFVDILPGTKIIFTDAKYTTLVPAQCPGGIVWTAPAMGISAGTVVTINNDAGTTDAGTITGSTFGLSSGGDQVIVYTGTNASPNYLTALSSNVWISSNITCGGSFSILPSALADGVNSINLSTAPDNVAGNTVNAYYNGPMNGTSSELKTWITNPANWIGTTSGTPAQLWPAWAFPGPPIVTGVSVINSTTIRVIFNRDLDPVSATNVNNFTGITGLLSVTRTDNGTLNDTLLLSYSNSFAGGISYSLTISGVKDSENRTMAGSYPFSFTYNTTVSFNVDVLSVSEAAGQATIQINLTNPLSSSVDLVVKPSPFSTAGNADFSLSTQTLNFTGNSNSSQIITVPIVDDNQAEQDEYFVLMLENPAGLALSGNQFITVYIRDNDRTAPVLSKRIELSYLGSYDPSGNNNASAEIVAYDSASKRLFIISAIQNRLDIADFSNPDSIQPINSIDMTGYGGITSVAVRNGIVAAAAPNANQQLNGSVVFFNTDGIFQKQVTVGALPDMITFTPDGQKVMTANEGQPNDSYTLDPEGSVSIIDISGGIASLSQSNVTTLDFTAFNAQTAALLAAGVRKGFPGSTLSQDLEPEYITVSSDSKKAWVILQEANAFAVIDLTTLTINEIWPLGKKEHIIPGNGFDASDRGSNVHISNWPVKGLYMPDGIASYNVGSTTYIVGANEGDDREYSAFNERVRVNAATYKLDSVIFPNAGVLKNDNNLGRLRVTTASGDTDGDGDFDEIHLIGGRSFTIWNAATKSVVYDSKDEFEQYLSKTPLYAPLFNADNESNTFKGRSSSKGPEPEGVSLAKIAGRQYAFVGLERQGGIMAYDITDPANVELVDYYNPRNLVSFGGDNGPEGITYISNTQSPDGNHYLVVANEISGTLSIYRITGNLTAAPVVSINSPMNNAVYPAGSTINLSALASDADGSIVKVEFYDGAGKFAIDSIAPYEFIGQQVEPGTYILTARAFDNSGDSAVSDTVRVTVTACNGSGSITVLGYTGIPGSRLLDLASHPSYPTYPSVITEITKLEYGPNLADNYGAKTKGYICAPETGYYIFYIASDDQSELWLSTDDKSANIRRIANVDNWVYPRAWFTYSSQKSEPIRLIKGARYYIETIHKEYIGSDHLAVAWKLPNGSFEGPIPGNRLSPVQNPLIPASPGKPVIGGTLKDGLSGLSKKLIVGITPNPSTAIFTLTTNSSVELQLVITVTDVLGRVIERRTQVPANGKVLLGNTWGSGIYFIEVSQGMERQRIKVIKN